MFSSTSPTIDHRRKPASHRSSAAHPADDHCSTSSMVQFSHQLCSPFLVTASICSPFFCCFRRTGKCSSQVKKNRGAAVGSAHIQTSEASEAIRQFACCKDAWHPRKSGAGSRCLGLSLPLEFSVRIPDVHLISISSYFLTCQSQGLAVSCARRKLLSTFFSSRERSGLSLDWMTKGRNHPRSPLARKDDAPSPKGSLGQHPLLS